MRASRSRARLAMAVGLLAGVSLGQAGVGVIKPATKSTGFGTIAVWQVFTTHLPGDADGVFTCCITRGPGQNLVMGKYDLAADTFTASNEAANLNPDASNFGLTIEPTQGLYCVFDRGDGVYFSTRPDATSQFAAPVKISGFSDLGVDPALARLGGKLFLIRHEYAGDTIEMQELDVTIPATPKVVGAAVTIARPLTAGGILHSPTPIVNCAGDLVGLFLSEANATLTSSEQYFKATLDPSQKQIQCTSTGRWANNGGVAGGRLLFASNLSSPPNAVHYIDVSWLVGDTARLGGRIDLHAGGWTKSNTALMLTFLAASEKPPLTLPAPFHVGQLGLDLASLLSFAPIALTTKLQQGCVGFGVPNNAALRGLKVPVQGLLLDTSSAFPFKWAWSNTARLDIL